MIARSAVNNMATIALVVPCFNEAGYIDPLMKSLMPQLEGRSHWNVVLVDDASTDATPAILATLTASHPNIHVFSGTWGSPGGTRSAGVAKALHDHDPDWIITVDADVEATGDWVTHWEATLASVDNDETCGAVNGAEQQDHLFADYPNAAMVSAAFGVGVACGEGAVGVTNLNGVNHAVRSSAYLTAGPYVQPTMPGPEGTVFLAGEDWDLGVRLRRDGYRIEETSAAVRDRGRRLLADVRAYVSGDAYEGAFRRLSTGLGSPHSVDVDSTQVETLVDRAVDRSLRHFYMKPILAGVVAASDLQGLDEGITSAMDAWINRWPHPTFDESRNGFIFGRLARFSDLFTPQVRRDLGLELPAVLAELRTS